jgi:type I restriction enzyme S subunit
MAFNSLEIPLSEIVTIKGGKRLPAGENLQSTPSSHPYIRVRDVGQRSLSREGIEYVPDDVFPSISRYIVQENDIVLSVVGTIGSLSIVNAFYSSASLTENCVRLTGLDYYDALFLYYYLASSLGQQEISQGTVGAVQPKLPIYNIEKIKVLWPGDKEERQKIASVLGRLDDKIELIHHINQTLETMAQAIFKSWFVDFDPVKAKIAAQAEGRDPLRAAMCAISGKPDAELNALSNEQYEQLAATAALFPDEMVESELGGIPKGWSYQTLAQLTDKIGSGSTPRGGREVYVEEGVALIRSQNVYDSLFVWEGLARISDEAATQLKGVTVQEDDVLLNITGASILRTCVVEPDALPARVNQHVAIIRAKAGVPPRFIHMHLLRPEIKSYLLGLNAGASREAITKAHIESLTLLTPGPVLLAAFQTATAPLFRQVQRFAQQMRVLDELRNTLLPKLLSGELSVEALAEPAGAA